MVSLRDVQKKYFTVIKMVLFITMTLVLHLLKQVQQRTQMLYTKHLTLTLVMQVHVKLLNMQEFLLVLKGQQNLASELGMTTKILMYHNQNLLQLVLLLFQQYLVRLLLMQLHLEQLLILWKGLHQKALEILAVLELQVKIKSQHTL